MAPLVWPLEASGPKTAAQKRLLDGFRKLLPSFDADKVAKPAKTELIVTVCNVIQYAFNAYKDPSVTGFKEITSKGQEIHHLNYELADDCIAGVLKIHLKEAKSVIDSDYGWGNKSDPYVMFSCGNTVVKSETIADAENPVWNSTHYLVIREKSLPSCLSDELRVTLFDDDTCGDGGIWTAFMKCIDQDDYLGTTSVALSKLQKPGVHSFDLELTGPQQESARKKTTVCFTVEHLSFEVACEEMGIGKTSPAWLHGDLEDDDDDESDMSDVVWLAEFGHVTLEPYAFIDVPDTDTQVWLHTNYASKMLLIAFRGTETSKIKDVLMDLTAYMTKLGTTSDALPILEPTSTLTNEHIRVHSGFLSAYESIREALIQTIYSLTHCDKEWDICVTGHSLGGALATLCAFELANRRNEDSESPVVGMINFGAPRVGNQAFADLYNQSIVESFRVVDQNDIIHLVPPFYTHTAKELLCLPDGDVYMEGQLLEHMAPVEIFENSRQVGVGHSDSGRIEDIYARYGSRINEMASKHLRQNYFSIVRAAAKKFFSGTVPTASKPEV